jgi:TonB family protein
MRRSTQHFFSTSHLKVRFRGFLFTAVLLFFAPRSTHSQQTNEVDQIASAAAHAINRYSDHVPRQKVLVTDFEERGERSQLGFLLTQDFAQALRKYAKNFDVIDHQNVLDEIANHKLPGGALSIDGVEACYASALEATVIVKAEFDYAPNGIVIDFDIFTAYSTQDLFVKKAVISPTAHMEALKSLPAPHVPDFDKDETVWVREPNAPSREPLPQSGSRGLSYPACIYCPQARYSAEGVKAKAQGTVTLQVVIGAEGSADRISIARSLPCGLDQQAIDAVKSWRFKPATNSEGKPVAVLQTIEVTFHVY